MATNEPIRMNLASRDRFVTDDLLDLIELLAEGRNAEVLNRIREIRQRQLPSPVTAAPDNPIRRAMLRDFAEFTQAAAEIAATENGTATEDK